MFFIRTFVCYAIAIICMARQTVKALAAFWSPHGHVRAAHWREIVMPALKEIAATESELIAWLRHLHAHPELAYEETMTADFIAAP